MSKVVESNWFDICFLTISAMYSLIWLQPGLPLETQRLNVHFVLQTPLVNITAADCPVLNRSLPCTDTALD